MRDRLSCYRMTLYMGLHPPFGLLLIDYSIYFFRVLGETEDKKEKKSKKKVTLITFTFTIHLKSCYSELKDNVYSLNITNHYGYRKIKRGRRRRRNPRRIKSKSPFHASLHIALTIYRHNLHLLKYFDYLYWALPPPLHK